MWCGMPRNKYWEQQEQEAREEAQRAQEEYDARMEAFDAGLCSLGAAFEGGARYERELAESATELNAQVAAPLAAAVNDWMRALLRAGKAA
jgi:hypothetical protein